MGLRALRKKLTRKIKVGDLVTWGLAVASEKVVDIDADGVYVDASSSGLGSRYFVSWEGGLRGKGPGPGAHVLVSKGEA